MELIRQISGLGIFLFFILLFLGGVFYGFAAAMQNASENELTRKSEAGDKNAKLALAIRSKPGYYLNVIPVLVIAGGVCFGGTILPVLKYGQDGMQRPFLLILLLVLVLTLFMCLILLTFRRIGTYHAQTYALRYVRLVSAVSRVFSPFSIFTSFISRIFAVPFGVAFDQKEADVTTEEIISMVDEAHEAGMLEENEAEMIQNIFAFGDTQAHDIMTHRKNVVAFDASCLLQEVIDEMLEEGNSRYPVYDTEIDNIIGIIHYKDALKFHTKNSWARFKSLKELPGLIREAFLIPETRNIGDLFRYMQKRKLQMAIVVDEYGQTAGIVSMEDILEEIVGEIMDEYDEEEAAIRTLSGGSVVIDALTRLDEVENELGVSFGEVPFETLNGFLTAKLGHIPTMEDMDKEISAEGYCFTILSLGNKVIGKVRACKAPQTERVLSKKQT